MRKSMGTALDSSTDMAWDTELNFDCKTTILILMQDCIYWGMDQGEDIATNCSYIKNH